MLRQGVTEVFPPEFDYRKAGTVEEALEYLAQDDAEVLAGGQSVLPELKTGRPAPGTLVDVGGVDGLEGIDVGTDETVIGALTTYADVATSAELRRHVPVMSEAAGAVGDLQVRNRGTIGGNLAQADPDGDLPAAVVAHNATIEVRGRDGDRDVPAEEFFLGDGETAVTDDELLTAIRVPHVDGAYVKKEHPATGYATVGVAAVVSVDGTVTDARVGATGVQTRPVRLRGVEESVVGEPPTEESIDRAAERVTDDLDPDAIPSDPYVSAEYRASLLETYTGRAIRRVVDRATGGDRG